MDRYQGLLLIFVLTLDNNTLPEATHILDLLSQFKLIQHISAPTIALGELLDVIMVSSAIPRVTPLRGWRRLQRRAFRDGLLSSQTSLL